MSSKALFLLTAVLAAGSLPGQTKQARKSGWGSGPVVFTMPENVEVVRDIVYASYGERKLKLDLYLPKQRPGKGVPGIIGIRGGGWQRGDKEFFAPMCATLASHGLAAASIEYRVMKEAKFPACVNDCKAAVRWMRAEGKKYGIRPDAIGATGESAGGHLAVLLGTSYKAADLEGDGGHAGVSSRVQAVVAFAPVFDFRTMAGAKEKGGEVPQKLFASNADEMKLYSPAAYIDADSAPMLIAQSKLDDVVPFQQSQQLLEAAKKAGVRTEFWMVTDGPHWFVNLQKWFPESLDRSAKFFHSVFGDNGQQGKRDRRIFGPSMPKNRLISREYLTTRACAFQEGRAVLFVRNALFLPARFRYKAVPEVLPMARCFFRSINTPTLRPFSSVTNWIPPMALLSLRSRNAYHSRSIAAFSASSTSCRRSDGRVPAFRVNLARSSVVT